MNYMPSLCAPLVDNLAAVHIYFDTSCGGSAISTGQGGLQTFAKAIESIIRPRLASGRARLALESIDFGQKGCTAAAVQFLIASVTLSDGSAQDLIPFVRMKLRRN